VIKYRTLVVVVLALAIILAGFLIALHYPSCEALYSNLVNGACIIAGIGAAKSIGEYSAKGEGIVGMVKTIFTSQKPPESTK
jgi:hypothetical protein